MKTPAIVAALTVAGSLAFAAGERDTPQPRLPTGKAPDLADRPPVAAADSCQPSSSEGWFSPVFRPIASAPGCPVVNYTSQTFNAADVNGDGTDEYFAFPTNGEIVSNYEPSTGCLVTNSRMTEVAGEVEESYVCILSASTVGASFIQRYGEYKSVTLSPQGWRDMDADGDLDLVAFTVIPTPDQPSLFFAGWFENIGYEKPTPPLAADLNEDGNVDGVDLGMLLASWGAQS